MIKIILLLCLTLMSSCYIMPATCDEEVVIAECTDDNSTTSFITTHEGYHRMASSSRRTSRCIKTVKQNNECKNEFEW